MAKADSDCCNETQIDQDFSLLDLSIQESTHLNNPVHCILNLNSDIVHWNLEQDSPALIFFEPPPPERKAQILFQVFRC